MIDAVEREGGSGVSITIKVDAGELPDSFLCRLIEGTFACRGFDTELFKRSMMKGWAELCAHMALCQPR